MENLEVKVKNEIKNVMNSVEYLNECIETYVAYNKGFFDGQETEIAKLIDQIKENKQQIAYLQGNNEGYAFDITQLHKSIIKDLQSMEQIFLEVVKDLPVIKNICKLNCARLGEMVNKHFANYLTKTLTSEVEYVK